MEKIEIELKKIVKDLFSKGKIDIVIGYEKGSLPLTTRPCFISKPEDIDKLVWNSFCQNNLSVYLVEFFQRQKNQKNKTPLPKVGIVAKGCDARSVIGLIVENQVPRENITIIGIPCTGMIDCRKIEKLCVNEIITDCRETKDGNVEITDSNGKTQKIKKEKVLAQTCVECLYPLCECADVTVPGKPKAKSKDNFAEIKQFESKSREERWRLFTEAISKCIRCNACRNACPNCYCKVCFIDQIKPRWVGKSDKLSEIITYHMGRIFHQAGRCVECDACVRACPMNIDLRLFTRKLVMDSKELFDFEPGLSLDDVPPLCAFNEEDCQDFTTEP